MRKSRFYFLEPSKVGTQHLTLLVGYVSALAASAAIRARYDIFVCAASSTMRGLPVKELASVRCESVAVMNPEKRRLVAKTLLEFVVVLAYLIRMRRGDRLLVTCLLPSTLLLVEWANRILRISGAHVVLHGEVEGLFDPAPQNSLSFGYWVSRWIRLRKPGSAIRLVVLDDFIRERLLAAFPENIAAADVAVLHHPILPVVRPGPVAGGPPTACFIGYRTKFKGFDQFVKLAKDHPTCRFLAIGGGKVEDMSAKDVQPSRSDQGYLSAIAGCDVAMFPYVSGYTCSLSAAALDALATGVHIIATDRPFFQSAALSFGSEFITVCSSTEDASKLLHDPAVWTRSRHRDQRLEQLSRSKYGLNAVRCAFETLAAV